MQKFLCLLATVVLAAFFGVNIICAQETYTAIAEVSFGGAGTFGFSLYQSTSGALPYGTEANASTNTINWNGVTVVAGSNTFVNSLTYALLTHDLVYPQEIFIYTDNVNGTKYRFTAASTTTHPNDIPSFVETSSTGTAVAVNPASKVDLAYIIISTVQYNESRFNKNGTGSGPAGIADIYIGLAANGADANYGTGFAKDISNAGEPNSGKGLAIANYKGYFAGYISKTEANYDYYHGINTYMFFSANFGNARKGYYYGTDTLTIELAAPGP